MNIIPCPFVLGTSRLGQNEVVPAQISRKDLQSEPEIKCNIKGLNYANVDASLKERNFATVVYNKHTKEVHTIFDRPEFLTAQFDGKVIKEEPHRAGNVDRNSLTSIYGSLRAKKYLRDLPRIQANAQAVRDADLLQKHITAMSKIKKDSDAAANGSPANVQGESLTMEERLLPPFDRTTSVVREIYPIDKLVPAAVANSLAQEAQELANSDENIRQKWRETARYPGFILDRLAYLPVGGTNVSEIPRPGCKRKSTSDGAPLTRLQAATNLALLGHMYRLLNLRPRTLLSKTPLPDTPKATAAYLLDEFTTTVERKRVMTSLLRDKLLLHIFVLILHCDDFTTYLDKQLPIDFKLPTDRLKKHFTFIGCSFSRTAAETAPATAGAKKHHIVARLTAPLKLREARSSK